MRHLLSVIHFTGRFDAMRRFYGHGLGLPIRRDEDDWAEFDTAGAAIALHRADDASRQGMSLRFVTDDLDATLTELRDRGLEHDGEITESEFGRSAGFWDADGNLLTLLEPGEPMPSGAGPPLETLIVNVADMVAATAFYRDRFGIPVLLQSPWWTELDTGATKVSLHPRVAATDELRHNAQAIVVGFDVPSLEDVGRELAERGLVFSGGPVDQRYGRFAEITDPDGNVVLFRRSEPRMPLDPSYSEGEQISDAYEDDSPHRTAMRKPGKKTAKATSRLAVKPAYHAKKRTAKSANGTRPAKKTPKSAKPGAASGRLHKSERRSAVRKKTAVAAASRGKPVKRAAAKTGGRRRG